MFGGLVTSVGLEVLFGRLKALVMAIPRQAWIALACLALLVAGHWLHQRRAEAAIGAARAAGRAEAEARWQEAFAKMEQAARQWRSNYEAASSRISAEIGEQHAQDLRSNASRARALLVRGPGRAAAACGEPGGGAGLSAAAGGHEPADRQPDAGLDGVPEHQPLAIVPWPELIRRAEEADDDRSEVTAWRNWYRRQKALHDDKAGELPEPVFGHAGDEGGGDRLTSGDIHEL
ncbi:MAG: hypothetical protein WCY29_16200 [Novosphingobium sp.]